MTHWDDYYETGKDFKQFNNVEIRTLTQFYPASLPRTALDIGCGLGVLSRQLADNGFRVLGIDSSKKAIEQASEQVDGRPIEYRNTTLDNVSGTFGLITCKLVYAFIEDKPAFLDTIKQRLVFGGVLLLVTPTFDDPIAAEKPKICVDGPELLRDVRARFRVIHQQRMRMGLLLICLRQ